MERFVTIPEAGGLTVRFINNGEFRGVVGACPARSDECGDKCSGCPLAIKDQHDITAILEKQNYVRVFIELNPEDKTYKSELVNNGGKKVDIIHQHSIVEIQRSDNKPSRLFP